METKNITMDELLEIEVLLEEASAWGLRNEVETTAKGYISDGHAPLDAYHFAYEDWIK